MALSLKSLVPAYIFPTLSDWDVLESAHVPGTLAVMNVASGPGGASDPLWVARVASAKAAGLTILGYVDTGFATVASATVKAQVDSYRAWYGVAGIFLDQVAGVAANLGYYQDLVDYVNSITVLNEGVYPDQAFAEGLTGAPLVHVAFEGTDASFGVISIPAWADTSLVAFAYLVYDVPDAAAMQAVVQFAAANGVTYVYATSDTVPNPWDTIPAYWSAEVTEILADAPRVSQAALGIVPPDRYTAVVPATSYVLQ